MSDFSTADLIRALDGASAEIKGEMQRLIDGAQATMFNRVYRAMPVKTGNLRRSVWEGPPRGYRGAGAIAVGAGGITPKAVAVTAPHVHFFEDGTRVRHDNTRKNANRGAMPAAGHIFEGIAHDVRGVMLVLADQMLNRPRTLA